MFLNISLRLLLSTSAITTHCIMRELSVLGLRSPARIVAVAWCQCPLPWQLPNGRHRVLNLYMATSPPSWGTRHWGDPCTRGSSTVALLAATRAGRSTQVMVIMLRRMVTSHGQNQYCSLKTFQVDVAISWPIPNSVLKIWYQLMARQPVGCSWVCSLSTNSYPESAQKHYIRRLCKPIVYQTV